jgi:hypothetical protein
MLYLLAIVFLLRFIYIAKHWQQPDGTFLPSVTWFPKLRTAVEEYIQLPVQVRESAGSYTYARVHTKWVTECNV